MSNKLTEKQQKFVLEYIKTGNAVQSYMAAGYQTRYMESAASASRLLKNVKIQSEISRLKKEEFQKNVASSEEVMDFFSRVMRGEVKDQFGLETSVADRIKAAQELAKRTVDIDNRIKGIADNTIEIKLDWNRPALGAGSEDAAFEVVASD